MRMHLSQEDTQWLMRLQKDAYQASNQEIAN